METPRVLIVEDSVEMADLLAITLQDDNIDTVSVENGEGALVRMREGDIDLVLLDLGLPDIDGMEVLARMRNEEALAKIPVIIITGREKMADKVKAFDLGAADYINKPINFLDVQARIIATLRRRERQRSSDGQSSEEAPGDEDLLRIGKAIDSTGEAISIADETGRFIYVNEAFKTLFAVTLTDLQVTEKYRRLFARANQWDEIWRVCEDRGSWRGETEMITGEGETVITHCRVDSIVDERKAFLGAVSIYTDIRQRKRLEEDLVFLANHDSLTGLHNRRFFMDRLKANPGVAGAGMFLLYVDLDHFKVVNHQINHQAGDRLLAELGKLIVEQAQQADVVARLGGDEFGILLNVSEESTARECARTIASAISANRFHEGDKTFSCTVSIGLACVDGEMASEEVLAHSVSACFQVKSNGGNGIEVFRPDQKSLCGLISDAGWFLKVQDALQENRLQIWLQPILPIKANLKPYFEALVRMVDENGKIVPPDQFLPAAEKFGILHEIDLFVFYQSVELLREHPLLNVSVNLSARTLMNPRLPELVGRMLNGASISPERVMFEITETTMIPNLEQALGIVQSLKQLGCRFALDDFGSGVSSLLYLKDLPVDVIKIDGSFINDLAKEEVNQAIVKSVHEVARILGKHTVAEYVSSVEVLQVVKSLGIDYAQGWHVYEPAPPEHFFKIGLENIALPRA